MSLAAFAQLAEIWGGDLARWPAEHRAAAAALLETSPEAAATIERERRLDAALDADPTPALSDALAARLLADAAQVDAERRPQGARSAAAETAGARLWAAIGEWVRALGGVPVAARLAGAGALAAAAGFVLGLETQSAAQADDYASARDTIYASALTLPEDSADGLGDTLFDFEDEAAL